MQQLTAPLGGWFWDGSQWCWWDRPGCPPPPPLSAAMQAQQAQTLTTLIAQAVQNYFVQNPVPPAPRLGVTDGSVAAPGEIGEFITGSDILSYPINTTGVTIGMLSPLVVPPGDWDLIANLETSTNTGTGAYFMVSPIPAGLSNNMVGWYGIGGTGPSTIAFQVMTGLPARGSFAVATALPFTVGIGTPPAAGTATLLVAGRRRR